MASLIENYGLIGDTESAGLVSREGALDWLCLPRFDSDACFAALLGRDEHGTWVIHPGTKVRRTTRRYRGDTMILETEFACDGGVVRLIDFMPVVPGVRHDVVRIVEGVEGVVPVDVILVGRFGYGATAPWIRQTEDGVLLTASPDSLRLRTPAKVDVGETRVSCRLEVVAGQRIPFELAWHPCHLPPPEPLDVDAALTATERFWTEWAGRCRYRGPHREAVVRSLLTLKALTYAPTGGIVAAPTSSLPEELGGVRNWDYRYCWLRDSALTARCADALRVPRRGRRVSPLAAPGGGRRPVEAPDHVRHRRRASPDRDRARLAAGLWRVAPRADRQRRVEPVPIDVYGEVLDTLYKARRLGAPPEAGKWQFLVRLLAFLERAWQRPDEGIWEVRGAGHRHFVHSKLMAWVAFNRAVKLGRPVRRRERSDPRVGAALARPARSHSPGRL